MLPNKKDMRIAIVLEHKDKSNADNSETLLFGDYVGNTEPKRRKLYIKSPNGERIPIHEGENNMSEIDKIISELIHVGVDNLSTNTRIFCELKADSNGNTSIDFPDVVKNFHSYFNTELANGGLKPYIFNLNENLSVDVRVLPFVNERVVLTELRITEWTKKPFNLRDTIHIFLENTGAILDKIIQGLKDVHHSFYKEILIPGYTGALDIAKGLGDNAHVAIDHEFKLELIEKVLDENDTTIYKYKCEVHERRHSFVAQQPPSVVQLQLYNTKTPVKDIIDERRFCNIEIGLMLQVGQVNNNTINIVYDLLNDKIVEHNNTVLSASTHTDGMSNGSIFISELRDYNGIHIFLDRGEKQMSCSMVCYIKTDSPYELTLGYIYSSFPELDELRGQSPQSMPVINHYRNTEVFSKELLFKPTPRITSSSLPELDSSYVIEEFVSETGRPAFPTTMFLMKNNMYFPTKNLSGFNPDTDFWDPDYPINEVGHRQLQSNVNALYRNQDVYIPNTKDSFILNHRIEIKLPKTISELIDEGMEHIHFAMDTITTVSGPTIDESYYGTQISIKKYGNCQSYDRTRTPHINGYQDIPTPMPADVVPNPKQYRSLSDAPKSEYLLTLNVKNLYAPILTDDTSLGFLLFRQPDHVESVGIWKSGVEYEVELNGNSYVQCIVFYYLKKKDERTLEILVRIDADGTVEDRMVNLTQKLSVMVWGTGSLSLVPKGVLKDFCDSTEVTKFDYLYEKPNGFALEIYDKDKSMSRYIPMKEIPKTSDESIRALCLEDKYNGKLYIPNNTHSTETRTLIFGRDYIRRRNRQTYWDTSEDNYDISLFDNSSVPELTISNNTTFEIEWEVLEATVRNIYKNTLGIEIVSTNGNKVERHFNHESGSVNNGLDVVGNILSVKIILSPNDIASLGGVGAKITINVTEIMVAMDWDTTVPLLPYPDDPMADWSGDQFAVGHNEIFEVRIYLINN